MSREILDCLKRERDIYVKNVIHSQNTAFMFTPALILFGLLIFELIVSFFSLCCPFSSLIYLISLSFISFFMVVKVSYRSEAVTDIQ